MGLAWLEAAELAPVEIAGWLELAGLVPGLAGHTADQSDEREVAWESSSAGLGWAKLERGLLGQVEEMPPAAVFAAADRSAEWVGAEEVLEKESKAEKKPKSERESRTVVAAMRNSKRTDQNHETSSP